MQASKHFKNSHKELSQILSIYNLWQGKNTLNQCFKIKYIPSPLIVSKREGKLLKQKTLFL